MRKSIAITIILLCAVSAMATKYAAEFTDLGVGVRPAGMGGTFTMFDSDPQALWWNPAGLVGLSEKFKFYFMHASMFDNLYQLDVGAAGRKFGETYWAVGFFRNATDNIPFIDEDAYFDWGVDGIPGTGDYGEGNNQWDPGEPINPDAVYFRSEGDYLFTIAAGRELFENFRVGASIKHLQTYIGEYSAFGFGADIGAIYRASENITVGATVRDVFGTHLRWSTGLWEQKLPSLWWGGKYDFDIPYIRGGLALAGEFETRFENYEAVMNIGDVSLDPHIGAELNLLKHFFLRVGIDRTDFTAGAGLALGFFRVDYAFVDNADLDVTHRIGINFEIPEVNISLPRRKVREEEPKPEFAIVQPPREPEPEEPAKIPAPVGEKLAEIKFPFASTELTDETKSQLDSVCAIWVNYRTNRIYIEGHTDNVPIETPEFSDNYALSKARANSAADYLRTVCGVPGNRIVVDWFGESRPKADNATPEGRSINRRVEIFLWEP